MSINNRIVLTCIFGIALLFIFSGCRQEVSTKDDTFIDQIVVRMYEEPETLSPILAVTSLAREAYQYLFLNLADYDYETLELKPLLIESIPEGIPVSEGAYAGTMSYTMKMRDEAVWKDGSPVTGHDVLFTYKIALHPNIQSPGWKAFLQDIIDVKIDASDDKKFTVYAVDNHFLNKEIILSAEVYPKHIFDSNQVLDAINLQDIKDPEKRAELLKNESFLSLGTAFSSIKYSKELVEGAGPYQLESWETGQFLVLKKKEGYWGENIDGIDQLETYPDRIILQFLNDEATALTLLKNDEIDLIDMTRSTYRQFDDLKEDPEFSARYNFQTTQLPRFYVLQLNNEDIRLSELAVRQAIGHLVDVDRMIRQIEGGYAARVNSIIHFSKPEYNKNLAFVDYNPEKANMILEKAGWIDSDGDSIRDKIINGRKENLNFRFYISGSNLSSSISAIVKDGCKQGGVNVEIIKKPNRATRTENLIPGDYEFNLTQKTQNPIKDDPYNNYHSSAIGIAGANFMRYSSARADELIMTIRESKNESERLQAYMNLQETIVEDAPVVFLYSPQMRIISDTQIRPVISAKRPGYFVNATEELK